MKGFDPFFIADDLALDFINSIAAPRGTVHDAMASGLDFLAWMEQAELVPRHVAEQFRQPQHLVALDQTAQKAVDLREWFRHIVEQVGTGTQANLSTADVMPINEILAKDRSYLQIDPQHGELRALRPYTHPDDLLIPIAETLARLICDTGFGQVKHCKGTGCTLWFNDISKNHKRRWCTMSVCGNRAKASAHRAKARKKLGK